MMCCHVCVDSSPASTPFTSGCRRTGCRSIQRSPKPSSSLPAADRVELRISHRLPSLVCESNRQRSSKVSASHSTAASHSTSTLPTSAKRRTFTSERFVTYVNRCRTTSQKLSPAASSDREWAILLQCIAGRHVRLQLRQVTAGAEYIGARCTRTSEVRAHHTGADRTALAAS